MKKANVASMKNRLSQYLAYVRRGGTVRVFDRNQPVADLVPIDHASKRAGQAIDAIVETLVRDGIVSRGTGRPKLPPHRIRARKSVAAAIVDERREGR